MISLGDCFIYSEYPSKMLHHKVYTFTIHLPPDIKLEMYTMPKTSVFQQMQIRLIRGQRFFSPQEKRILLNPVVEHTFILNTSTHAAPASLKWCSQSSLLKYLVTQKPGGLKLKKRLRLSSNYIDRCLQHGVKNHPERGAGDPQCSSRPDTVQRWYRYNTDIEQTLYRQNTDMLQLRYRLYRHDTHMVQTQYIHVTAKVQTWYRRSTYVVQIWYRQDKTHDDGDKSWY